jgi:hypothetical protein
MNPFLEQLSFGDDNDPTEPILQKNQQSRQSIHKDTKEGNLFSTCP